MRKYRFAGCIVSVGLPASYRDAEVCVSGDMDRDVVPMLTQVTDYLAALDAERVVMDLQHLVFAGAVLPNWLCRIQDRLGDRTPVVVRRPQPMVRWVLTATEMAYLIEGGRPTKVADGLGGQAASG